MMKVQAIIPAAGLGTRLQSRSPKPFLKINGKPLLIQTLKVFERTPHVQSVIVVGHPEYLSKISKIILKFSLKKVIRIVAGGATRAESVGKGLEATDSDTTMVLIHDAARPFVTSQLIQKAIQVCRNHHAVVAGVPVKSTIKRIHKRRGIVQETLNRSELWEIQTPQVFKRDIVLKAYEHFKKCPQRLRASFTDDASLIEALGIPVKVCLGNSRNIKITTPEDVALAQFYSKHS